MRSRVAAVLAVASIFAATPASAGCVTAQWWSFFAAPGNYSNIPPDPGFLNPNGVPVGVAPFLAWTPDQGDGSIGLSGQQATFAVPNCEQIGTKTVEVNLVYRMLVGTQPVQMGVNQVSLRLAGGQLLGGQFNQLLDVPLDDPNQPGSRTARYKWSLNYCPTQQTVEVFSPAQVDGVASVFYLKFLRVDTVCSDPIPTLSEWGAGLMTLMGLSLGTVAIGRRRLLLGPLVESSDAGPGLPTFVPRVFVRALALVLAFLIVCALGALAVYGSIATRDIVGASLCAPVLAYLIHLWIAQATESQP